MIRLPEQLRSPGALPPQGPRHIVTARFIGGGGALETFRLLPPGAQASALAARVTRHDPAGRILLDTPRGLYRLESGPELEVGTRVRLVPATNADRATPSRPQPPPANPLDQKVLSGLPAARVDQTLAASLFRLLQSTHVPRHQAGPIDRCTPDQATSIRMSPDGWQMLPLLITGEDDPALVRVFRHDDRKRAALDEGETSSAQRLLLEIDWSRLGRTQIDLLVRGKRLDARLRSLRPLPPAIAALVQDAFSAALAESGLEGAIRFESPDLAPLPQEPLTLR